MTLVVRFFALVIGHAFADFVFQSEFIAKYKNYHYQSAPPPGQKQQTVWPYVLTSHALVHGGVVWVITGNVYLGLAETLLHWIIDFGKCSNWYGIHKDQALHILCKVVYTLWK